MAAAFDLDPELDLLARSRAADVTADIAVTGPASAPTIALSSEPELPEDEIIARVLFRKGVGELSAFEALSLAQAAAQLSGVGGAGRLLDPMRQTIGLDRLEVDAGDGGSAVASVSAGQYVADGVFVGVEQGLKEQSSRMSVEIEVTPNITIETDVGADADSRIGVNIEWDY